MGEFGAFLINWVVFGVFDETKYVNFMGVKWGLEGLGSGF